MKNTDDEVEYEPELDYYSRKRGTQKKKKTLISGKAFLFILAIGICGISILLSPLFAIKNINLVGNSLYSKEDINAIIGLNTGDSLFVLNSSSCEKKLEKEAYILDAIISKDFPDTVNIEIKERVVRGYVNNTGSYLYIDEDGRVLEIETTAKNVLPIIEGLPVTDVVLDETLKTEDPKTVEELTLILQTLVRYDLLQTVNKINVKDMKNIMFYVDNIEINIGNTDNFDEKIRTMNEVIINIPKGDMGSVDLSDLSKPIVFKYKT